MFLVTNGLNVVLLLELRRLALILPRNLDHLPSLLFCQYRNMHGFHLHKGDLWDTLSLRYGITSSNTSSLSYQCGTSFSVDYQSCYSSVLLLCPIGGFHTIRHNEVRDLTTSLLTEVCHNVAIEHLYNQLF